MFDLKKLDESILEATKKDWNRLLEKNLGIIPAGDYQAALLMAEKYIKKAPGDNLFIYALTGKTAPNVAVSLLEISHARPNSDAPWLKLLDIRISPQFDINLSPSPIELAQLASQSVIGALGLTFDELESVELKVYGRHPFGVELLTGISQSLASFGSIEVSSHGNWLVIKK